MSRVLVADAIKTDALEALRRIGVTIDFQPDLEADTLPAAVPGAQVLVVRSTKVTRETLEAGQDLALIVRAGSGVNTIDVAEASARGIYVANCPGKNGIAVAELAMGLILAADRALPDAVADLRAGIWAKKKYSSAAGLKGRRLGLVGFGSIAQAVAERALAFEMDVHAYSRSLTEEQAEALSVVRAESLERLFEECDMVSLHLPLTDDTRGLVGAELLGRMKEGALLVNTARAEIVDEAALLGVAKSGRIRVATDVFHTEPASGDSEFSDPLGALPNVYGTHHIGASTDQAQSAIAQETVRIVESFVRTGEVISPVNLQSQPEIAGTLVVRHLDQVGVLASVLDKLSAAGINVQNMENVIFEGGDAACARIRVSEDPKPDVLAALSAVQNVMHIEWVS
jgi:D-3-phosphoglycerate dehydrogenase